MSGPHPADESPGSSSTSQAAVDACGALLVRIQRRDEQAFEILYREHGSILLATILRLVRNRSLAEEVLQDVFFEVWNRADTFRADAGTGRAWLTTMCRRRAIDRVRSVQAQQNRDFAEGIKQAPEVEPDIQAEALNHVEAVRLNTALRRLPADQARAIAMAYYQDLSHSEIATALDTPLGTVKSRIRDGMKRLRVQLEVNDAR
ncbi:sigma-70 family RNA polymerase sigma factor [Nesterenkonia populi]